VEVGGELIGQNMPFTIGVQSPWQAKMMIRYDHQTGIAIDSTVRTKENKVNIHAISIMHETLIMLYYLSFIACTMCSSIVHNDGL
jgi:hypothetical protein